MTIQEHLVYPSSISLMEIVISFAKKMKEENVKVQSEEGLKEKLREIARLYCEKAWKDEKPPLYLFDSNWNSSELEHDLDFIIGGQLVSLSDVKINEVTLKFLENYEKMGIFSDYLTKNVEEIIDKVTKEMKEQASLERARS